MKRLPASQFSSITTLKGMSHEDIKLFSFNNIRHYFRVMLYDQSPACAGCGTPFENIYKATLDHIVPRAKGGRTRLANLQLMCNACNNAKHDNMPSAYHPLAFTPIDSHKASFKKHYPNGWPAQTE